MKRKEREREKAANNIWYDEVKRKDCKRNFSKY